MFVFQAQLVQAAQIVYNRQTDGGGGAFLAKGKNVSASTAQDLFTLRETDVVSRCILIGAKYSLMLVSSNIHGEKKFVFAFVLAWCE